MVTGMVSGIGAAINSSLGMMFRDSPLEKSIFGNIQSHDGSMVLVEKC